MTEEEKKRMQLPCFNTILYQRLEALHGISKDVAQKVLEEIAVSTAIYLHESRKLERRAIAEVTGRGEVVHLQPGATSIDNATPEEKKKAFEQAKSDYVKSAKRLIPVGVEL